MSGGHAYEWHDGRLHALGTTLIVPGTRYLGRWEVPVTIDGRGAAIAGGLYYKPDPPLVWFWPIAVVLACVFAALRLRRPELDWRVARALAFVALVAFAVAAVGQGLHGRPGVTPFQLVVLAFELAFVVWGLRWLLLRRQGWFALFLIAVAAIYEGATLVEVLLRGFVRIALPALVARLAVATCLCAGIGARADGVSHRPATGLLGGEKRPTISSTGRTRACWHEPCSRSELRRTPEGRTGGALLLVVGLACVGCGSAERRPPATALPAALVREARSIGRGPRFQPPARGPIVGPGRGDLGPRVGVHVELFAANRVVLVASGIGTRPPRSYSEGRISKAGCYGALVTLEPTGVVLVRRGARLHLSDLFRAWGQPLSSRSLATFSPSPNKTVRVFVGGRPWARSAWRRSAQHPQ